MELEDPGCPPWHLHHPPSGQSLGRQPSLGCAVSGAMAAGARLSARGLGVSPQLFSGLHHYQVPHVVDLLVQQAMMFLGWC